MENVLLVAYLLIVLALIAVILIQRSEGGGLGIGGGSGFMTARGAANVLTRATAILAAAFFVTSLGLSLIARYGEQPLDILDRQQPAGQQGGVLDQLGGTTPAAPATVPAGSDPAVAPAAGDIPVESAPAQPAEPQAPNQ